MVVKKANLQYWVFYHTFNTGFKKLNILEGMSETIAIEIRRGKITCKNDLYNWLKTKFINIYWSRCEYEYIIGDLFARNIDLLAKKDVYYQIEDNLDMITDYIIAKMEIKFEGDDSNGSKN